MTRFFSITIFIQSTIILNRPTTSEEDMPWPSGSARTLNYSVLPLSSFIQETPTEQCAWSRSYGAPAGQPTTYPSRCWQSESRHTGNARTASISVLISCSQSFLQKTMCANGVNECCEIEAAGWKHLPCYSVAWRLRSRCPSLRLLTRKVGH